ncbi:MAG: S-layer homology domain-containing protein [Clostridiales bacterium]|nr:S-layer homology domain-containing protein [Clostridiales bacterium]
MKKAFKTLAAAFLPTILTVTAFNAHVLANTDDISGHWAETQIKEWANIGYISGYPDGTFLPDNSITRAEFLTLVNKIFKFENKININFIDVRPDYWAYSEIQKGISAGYVSGDKNGTFRPDDFITRQEAAVIINKLLDNTEITENKPNFKDAYDIDEWAKNSVDIVYEYGILSGFPNGTYRPKKYMTRAEAVSALKRLTEIKGTEDIGKNEYILREEQMKDKIIDGDLIITDDMDTVNLAGVTVKGNVYVKGGNVIHAENCNINKLITDGEDFTFEADENTTVDKTEFNSCGKISGEGFDEVIIDDVCNDEIIIDGDIKNVVHNAKTDIFIGKNADIENFKVTENAESSHIKFEKGSKVKNAEIYGRIKIVGEGEIGTMEVYTSGVESSIRPDDVTTAEGAEDPHYIELRPILKGEDFNKENLTLDKDFDGKGKNYKNVTITDNAAVSDINASGDVIIENCDVVLKDVSVEGDVVVCGNGSVELEDCLLKKDIVTVKDDDFKKIVFDNKTKLYGKLIIEGNTEISSECDITVDEVDINSDAVINVNVDKMNVLSDSLIELHDGKTIDYVDIFDGVGAVEFNMNGFSSFIEDIASEKTKIKFSGMGQVGTVKTDNADNITTDSGITIDDIISDFVPVSNVILAPSEGKTGEVLELNINVEPKNASNKNAIYKIVDDGGTDVKINGNKLVADKSGVIKIKVEIEDGIGIGIPYIKDCIVEIKDNIIPVSDIIMENEDWVYAGEELELKAHVEPEDATYNEIEWSVLEGYAYIEGNIFMHDFTDSETVVRILAEVENGAADGGTFSREFEITVIPPKYGFR